MTDPATPPPARPATSRTTAGRATAGRTTPAAPDRTPRRPAARASAAAPSAPTATTTTTAPAALATPGPAVVVSSPTPPSVAVPAVVATPAVPTTQQAAGGPSAMQEWMPVLYGLVVVIAGFVALLIALWLIVINSNPSDTSKGLADPTAFLGLIAIAIAALAGSFFAVAVSWQAVRIANKERAAAVAARDAVQLRAERYLAYLEPEVAKNLIP